MESRGKNIPDKGVASARVLESACKPLMVEHQQGDALIVLVWGEEAGGQLGWET